MYHFLWHNHMKSLIKGIESFWVTLYVDKIRYLGILDQYIFWF